MSQVPAKSGVHPADNPSVSAVPLQPPPVAYAPPGVLPPVPAESPLSREHLLELSLAKTRQKKVLRAVSVATVDAWFMAFFGALTLVAGLTQLPALTGLIIGAALAAVAFNSFRGLSMLKKLNPRGPWLLGMNQLFLASSITVYAAWQIYTCLSNPKEITQSLLGTVDPELLSVLSINPETMARYAAGFYALVIAATWLAQGLTGLYYFTRRKHVESYLASTPQWIHDLQRAQQK